MINTEDCYIVLNDDGTVCPDFSDILFESLDEAEVFLEKQGEDPEFYVISSLSEFLEDL
jgi:hypothetical protein